MKFHYTDKYILNPTHRITVNLIGCGGTGSQVLSGLARMNKALLELGHPGLYITVFDHDIITEANIGRQLFSPSDINQFKATVSVSRVNRFFGFDWTAVNKEYNGDIQANITITCVDSAKARVQISKLFRVRSGEPYNWTFYWMDFGNLKSTGQVVLGTVGYEKRDKKASENENSVGPLKDIIRLLPGIRKVKEADQGPSCSLAQALNKQDLFINSTLANLGLNLLWKLFREGRIQHQGCYLNLESMSVNPIKIG